MSKYFQTRREDYFFDYVKDELYQSFPARVVRRGGLRVHTTIDLDKQDAARTAIAGRIAGIGPSSAIVTIDPDNGEIVTMASSADYGKSKFNLAAQGHRQPGSSFKTMALMAALRRGVDPDTTYYTSKPLNFDDPTYGHIETKTYDGSLLRLDQPAPRRRCSSDNSVYMQLALDVGPENVKETADDMGITTKLDGYPAETLGGLDQRRLPARDGQRLRDDRLRRRLAQADRRSPRSAPPTARAQGQEAAQAPAARVRAALPGRRHLQGRPTSSRPTSRAAPAPRPPRAARRAGKTGTTDEHSDGWFVGFTPHLSQRRVGRLSRRQRPHVHGVPRRPGRRRHLPGRDLGRLHARRQGRRTATPSRRRRSR